MRASGFDDFGGEKGASRSPRIYLGALALLAVGACGAIAVRCVSDRATSVQPLEMSMRRVQEIRADGSATQAQLAAHLLNVLNRTQEGIAQLSEIARGNDATAEWARRALASIRRSAEDPGSK